MGSHRTSESRYRGLEAKEVSHVGAVESIVSVDDGAVDSVVFERGLIVAVGCWRRGAERAVLLLPRKTDCSGRRSAGVPKGAALELGGK